MLKNQPYKILWWTIPVMFLLIVFGIDSTFDIQKHDTYYVVSSLHLTMLFTLILSFLGGIYWLLRFHKLQPILNMIHALGTSFCFIGIVLSAILQSIYRTKDMLLFNELNSIGAILIFMFFIFQFIFIINILIGLIRGKKV